ncbi:MAG: response regulator, partial [Planctomycetota bacterium]
EIRTPMTAILGHAELCKDPETSVDEFRRHLEIICINGEHLLTVMNDILDVSRIEAGRMPVERTLCSPTKIVSEAVAMMEGQAHEKALEVHVQSVGTIPEMIETDPTRLRQILLNVIGNAVKFTESGAIELTLTMSVADGGGQRLAFEIRDSGVGMAPDKLDSVFEPFVQADTSTTREYGGTGLGLSISRAFARMLGGDLTCESEEGAGSRFLLTIDPGDLDGVAFIEVEGCVDFVDAPLPARAESESQTFEGRALVVEDVAVNRRLICRLLTKAGLEVEEAENGQVGFDKAMESFSQGRPFDVVFMDLQMPVLDGYDATRRLRDQGYPGLIVALTAHTMPEERERCLAAGCDDFATKPIDRAAFMELLASLAQDASERPAGGAGGLLAVSVKPRRK